MKRVENKYLIYDNPRILSVKYAIKFMISILCSVFYKIIYIFLHPTREHQCKYRVSICAIFKDEADYLKEWIEFHKIVGVEHFYLYNNNSSDDYISVLRPYVENGLVTLIDWPIPQGQMQAYKDFMDRYSEFTEWVGFIDIDEYVVPNKTDNIYKFLSKYKYKPAVVIYWKIFGTSGVVEKVDSKLLTETFIVGWPKYVDIGKFFFNTKFQYVDGFRFNEYMHSSWGKYKRIMFPPVNCFGRIVIFGRHSVPNDDMPIQINHYVTKSYEEYYQKKMKRGGGVHKDMHNMDYFFEHETKCKAVDYHIYAYLLRLKLAMKENERLVVK